MGSSFIGSADFEDFFGVITFTGDTDFTFGVDGFSTFGAGFGVDSLAFGVDSLAFGASSLAFGVSGLAYSFSFYFARRFF